MKSFSYRPISLCVLLVASVLGSVTAHAKDYLIEMVIFENTAGRKLSAGGLYYPKVGKSLRLNSDTATAAGFVSITDGLSLTENAADMASSERYRVLRHFAWRQPGLDTENAVAVRINIGEPITVFLPENLRPYDKFIPASLTSQANRQREVPTFTINGTIKVRLGRFLHMETLLVFTDPNTGQGFQLGQSRKMRSRELHYIDNPRFGILTRILPLDDELLSKEETADATDAPATTE